jgi:hypothetical protein
MSDEDKRFDDLRAVVAGNKQHQTMTEAKNQKQINARY